MTDTLRSAIYCRQSKDHLVGIGNQLKANEKLAADRGYQVVARLSDNDISASKSRKRPGYEKLMALVRAGEVDVVQVTQMDRLYRQPIELENIIQQIEQAGVLIATAREGDMNLKIDTDQLRARVQVAFARAEVQRKANRQIHASEQAARAGKRNKSGARPFGYAANRVDPLEPEAQAVRDAIDSVLRGGSVNGISRRWSGAGLRPPLAPYGPLTQYPWNHRSVRHILMNPHVAGLRAYNGVIVATGDWVPLITVEKWEAAQMVLSDPSRVKPRGALSLLGGIAECRCGVEVKHATRPQRGSTPGYGTYRCAGYEKEGHAGSGPHVCVKADWIDQYVEDVLLATLERPDAAKLFAPPDAVDVPRLKEEMAVYDAALANLSWQQSMGAIPDHVFMANAAKINAERDKVAVQITEAGKLNAAVALLSAADVRAEWAEMNISERRAAIRALGMHITLRPAGSGCRRPDYDRMVRIAWVVLGRCGAASLARLADDGGELVLALGRQLRAGRRDLADPRPVFLGPVV